MRLLILILLLTISANVLSQNYIQFNEQYQTAEGVIIFKDEIYKADTTQKILQLGNKSFIYKDAKIGNIKNITDDDLIETKNRIKITKIDDDLSYSVDISEFYRYNQIIKFIRQNNSVVELSGSSPELINIKNAGKYFRIIIPNKPSIVYLKEDILYNSESINEKDHLNTGEYFNKFTIWHYLIGSLILLVIAVFGYLYGVKKLFFKKKYPIHKRYDSGDLNDFAIESGISREQLIRYNKKELNSYLDLKTKKEKENFKKALKGIDLIVGYSETPIINMPNNGDVMAPKPPDDTFDDSQPIQQLLFAMEQRILTRISSLVNNKEAAQNIEILQRELESMRLKNKQVEGEIIKVRNDNEVFRSDLVKTNREKQELENIHLKYTEKIVFVDYLEPYAKAITVYYNFCNQGFEKAVDLYEHLDSSNLSSTNIVGHFLLKFIKNIPSSTIKWIGIINEIAESKTTANQDLIRSLIQIPSNEEKTNEFKKILLKDVFEKYTSSILILTEELKNLSKFTNENTAMNKDFEVFFTDFSKELKSKVSTIGLDLNFVPLFESYTEYVAHIKLVSKNCSLPYRNVRGLPKDSVLEIVNYGFGNKETNVIVI
ncbi:MAG: hypothetical protein K0B15_04555 [Lentimicrobium sp.]|nr:hypothetical protein [Lentimicrobium sp.]